MSPPPDDQPLFMFIVMADPQFGLYTYLTKNKATVGAVEAAGLMVPAFPPISDLKRERTLFAEAIAAANAIHPAFVVVCGDLVNEWDDEEQFTALTQIAGSLSPDIPLQWVAGNHDVTEDATHPTPRAIAKYRERFGADYYAFQHRNVSFIVMDSTVIQHPSQVQDEYEANLAFLESELAAATLQKSSQTIVFSHHPWFLLEPGEDVAAQRWMVIPPDRRARLLELSEEAGVSAVFTGHTHRSQTAQVGAVEMVQTTAVGCPLGDDPSGFRIVRVYEDRLEHETVPLPSGLRFQWESEFRKANDW
jgi:3',5'-cyclic AMP phosphodiesterase CpdA